MARSAGDLPCNLLSPTGIVYHVADEAMLKKLCEAESITERNARGLVGLQAKRDKSTEQWQRVEDVKFVRNEKTGEMLPVVGASAARFLKLHPQRADLQVLKEGILQKLLTEKYTTTCKGKPVPSNSYKGWGLAGGQVEPRHPALSDPVEYLREFHARSPFTPPVQVHEGCGMPAVGYVVAARDSAWHTRALSYA